MPNFFSYAADDCIWRENAGPQPEPRERPQLPGSGPPAYPRAPAVVAGERSALSSG
jgi:hypothetical protein